MVQGKQRSAQTAKYIYYVNSGGIFAYSGQDIEGTHSRRRCSEADMKVLLRSEIDTRATKISPV